MQACLIAWNENMSVGVQLLDDDHKKMLDMINDLHNGIVSGAGTERLGRVLDGLVHYLQQHFAHEEELFVQTGYPDAAAHIVLHREMSAKVLDLQKRYEKGKFDSISVEALEMLQSWMTSHMQNADKKYQSHLNSLGIH